MSAWAFYGLVMLLPFEPPHAALRAWGLEFTLVELGGGLALLAVGLHVIVRGRLGELLRSPLFGLAVAFLAACLLSSAFADPPRLMPFKFTLRVAAGVTAFGLAAVALRNEERIARLMEFLALAGSVVAIVALAEAVALPGVAELLSYFRSQDFEVGGARRIAATFSYPNTAGGFLVLALPGALLFGSREPSSLLKRSLALVGAAVMFVAIVLTYSRGALLGALTIPCVFWAWGYLRRERPMCRRAAWLFGAFVALTTLKAFADPHFRLRTFSETDASWYRALFLPEREELHLEAGELGQFPISVRNRGRMTWQSSGERGFHLSYHWYDPTRREVLELEGERTKLPGAVTPGQTVRVLANVRAPEQDGRYLLVWDMVQEETTWFVGKGDGNKVLPVVVGGSLTDGVAAVNELSRAATVLLRDSWFPGRLELWSLAGKLFIENPLLGVGPDNFRWLYGPAAGHPRWDTRVFSNSLYLETLATTGLVGGIAFFGLLVGAILGCARVAVIERIDSVGRTGNSSRNTSLVAVALVAALVGFLTHGLFDYLLEFTPIYLAFYLVLGAASALIAANLKTKGAKRKVFHHACWF